MGNQEESLSTLQQQTNVAPVSSTTTDLIQQNLSQFIELQREQQHSMDRFLSIQEQLLAQMSGQAIQPTPVRPVVAPVIAAAMPHQPIPVMPAVPISAPAPAITEPSVAEATPHSTTISVSGSNGKSNGHDTAPTDFKSTLLAAVSERTGYPEDMLDMDANLEADLGIDSIKRAEIFSSLGQHQDMLHGVSEETLLEELTGLQTLNKIVEWYQLNEQKSLAKSDSEAPPKKP